ncbi:MAG TPA: OsmC family protein [Longimicrobiales bacterium]|nr:OsmC family protein [Longimicrobiales bacterium]
MPVRSAEAVWNGTLRDGNGTMKMESGAYEGQYSFASRFEEGTGTNPEELIAAAHAGCFSMALSAELTKAGIEPKRIETSAQVHLNKGDAGFGIEMIELATRAEVPGIDQKTFLEHAEQAKKGCPVSRALQGVDIRLKAVLL